MYEIFVQLLRETGLSAYQFSKRAGIAQSTLSDWKRGVSRPRNDKMNIIAKYFGVSVEYLMGEADERNPEAKKEPAVRADSELVKIDRLLNEPGHKEWVRYGKYLTSQPEFECEAAHEYTPDIYPEPVECIRDYQTPSAAGYAAPIEGEDYIDVPRDASTPLGADFSVHVAGDSMEPYIKDGQRVFVKSHCPLQNFDVGIFYYDGDVFIKQYCTSYDGSVYLLSANPKREDANKTISRDANSTLICFGKVLLDKKLPAPVYGQQFC
ncbi:MAG: S24 family peptidase [Oscillospiraceae bacterium]|nr:S24 family peptidase [Oscillospiraceae bacterium]